MTFIDDDLTHLEAHGLPALPAAVAEGHVIANGVKIWHALFGDGPPVVLLHGGLGNLDNWAYQIPFLVRSGFSVVGIDSRGHGRSTRDDGPYSYQAMASDTRAVLDTLGIKRAAFVGWSDGAVTSLVLARETPERVAGVFFFACNVDSTGGLPFQPTPVIDRIYNFHVREYRRLSSTPDGFEAMRDDLNVMQGTEPDYGPDDLAAITVPVWSVIGENDEFIRRDHASYIASSIPGASFHLLPRVSHFAPMQSPDLFNASMLSFLRQVYGR